MLLRPLLLAFALLCCSSLPCASPAFAEDVAEDEEVLVQASLLAEREAFEPGQEATLALRLVIAPKWHVYWQNPGDGGVPTTFALELPAGVKSPGVAWPAPLRLAHEDGFVDFAYEGEVLFLIPVKVPQDFRGETLAVEVAVTWLVCKESCIPGEAKVRLALPVRAGTAKESPHAKAIAAARARLATPLPKGVSARFDGLELRLSAPGAQGLTWFPLLPEAAGPRDLRALEAKGSALTITYPEGVRKAKQVRGLLALRGAEGTTYHWVEVSAPDASAN